MKKTICLILILTCILLCACHGSNDTSETPSSPSTSSPDTEVSKGEVSRPAESLPEVSDSQGGMAEYEEYFYEAQAYTDYFDVVHRIYDDASKTSYTDRFGMADSERNLICQCKFDTYCQPVVIDRKVVEGRFTTLLGGKPVLIDRSGNILCKSSLSALSFPASLAGEAAECDIDSIVGIATLEEDGKSALISFDGRLSDDRFASITLTDKQFYTCVGDENRQAFSVTGEKKGTVKGEYEFANIFTDGWSVIKSGQSFGISNEEGDVIVSGLEEGGFTYSKQFDWVIYQPEASNAVVFSSLTGERLTSIYSKIVISEQSNDYAIGYFTFDTLENTVVGGETVPMLKTQTFCRLIDRNGMAAFTESWLECEFIDSTLIYVTHDNGKKSDLFVDQLTKLVIPECYVSILANLDTTGGAMVSFFDIDRDGTNELLIRTSDTGTESTLIYMPDGTLLAHIYGSLKVNGDNLISECGKNGTTWHVYNRHLRCFNTFGFATSGDEKVYFTVKNGENVMYVRYDGTDISLVITEPLLDPGAGMAAVERIEESEFESLRSLYITPATSLGADFFRY